METIDPRTRTWSWSHTSNKVDVRKSYKRSDDWLPVKRLFDQSPAHDYANFYVSMLISAIYDRPMYDLGSLLSLCRYNDSQRTPTCRTGELNPPFKEIPISFPIISRGYRTINTTSSKVITDKLSVQWNWLDLLQLNRYLLRCLQFAKCLVISKQNFQYDREHRASLKRRRNFQMFLLMFAIYVCMRIIIIHSVS